MIPAGARAIATAALSLAAVACLTVGVGAHDARSRRPGAAEHVALKSERPAPLALAQAPRSARPSAPAEAAPSGKKGGRRHAAEGLVLGPDGEPVPAAKVYWVGFRR